jgi:ABC-type dipeptide/oligopeptide/nickel transport system permease subunit
MFETSRPIEEQKPATLLDESVQVDWRTYQKTSRNWPLGVGGLLVLGVLFIALFGPQIAPQDPMQIHFTIRNTATGKFVKPPFGPFTVPGYPLGADEQGRDIFSQLLWAVRPSLNLVLLVAAIRLILGLTAGLVSGWSKGGASRFIETLISAALAVPVLFVALCVIAALGIKFGAWAFILGLSITGWAEAARIVQGQTRIIKGQLYIEAARSLGASGSEILSRHIIPHISPLMWMLLSFEVSGALMATAGLGFLGYFINTIWVPHGDFSALRTSGRPELGQMLSESANMALRVPWGLVAAASMVFIIVLAFNLLGMGIRTQLDPARKSKRKGRLAKKVNAWSMWAEDRWYPQIIALRRNAPAILSGATLLALIFWGGSALWKAQASSSATSTISVPGGHLWADVNHDAQSTYWANVPGPTKADIAWTFEEPSGFAGGPVVAADGTIYLPSNAGILYALNPEGKEIWHAMLPASPFGTPALNPSGDIYIIDVQGNATAYTPDGKQKWSIQPDPKYQPISSPISDSKGNLYYASDSNLICISSGGKVIWKDLLPTFGYTSPLLRLSADEKFIFFQDAASDAQTGRLLFKDTYDLVDRYIVGTDGKNYLASQGEIKELRDTETGAELVEYAKWDVVSLSLGVRAPYDAGIAPDGRVWTMFTGYYELPKILWVEKGGDVIGSIDYPWLWSTAAIIGLDRDGIAYFCGITSPTSSAAKVQCRANKPGQNVPLWSLDLDRTTSVVGGALVPGSLYITTSTGTLYSIGSNASAGLPVQTPVETQAAAPTTAQPEILPTIELSPTPENPRYYLPYVSKKDLSKPTAAP